MATSNDSHKQETTSKNDEMFSEEDLKKIYKYEHILNSKDESLEKKINALITTWGELASLSSSPSKENLRTLTEFLKSHTLNIVLSASWLKYQDKYYKQLWNSIISCSAAFSAYKGFQILCGKLASITKSPWGKPTILQILNTHHHITQIEDYNFFVHEESGYFISMRLKKLCEDRCEDMALNLTRAYINCCEWAEMNDKSMFISEDQKKFVFDVYLALLYKFSYIQEMSMLLKNVSLAEGIDMVRRFTYKLVSVSRIWIDSTRIAQFAGTVFLTRTVMKNFEEAKCYLVELLRVWLPLYERNNEMEDLISCLRRIMKNAISASHMYIILGTLSDKFGNMTNYSVEICIQALNTDLNLLEKIKTENDKLKEEETTWRIADGLLKLAAIFKDNLNVARECVLSSFSLRPTASCLRQIEDLARASGYEVLDTGQWACKYHPPETADDELLYKCSSCGQYMPELQIDNSVKQPNIALTEALHTNNIGLCQQLRDDLVVIIFCSRYQLLNWLQKWKDLHRLCAMYLRDPDGTKNLITELKYVDIDYTPFLLKRELEMTDSQDYIEDIMAETFHSRKRKRSESPVDLDEKPFIPNFKSDPDVLKTLRSFRRTLKNKTHPKLEMPSNSWHDAEVSQVTSYTPTPTMSLPNAQIPEIIQEDINTVDITLKTPTQNGIKIRNDIFDTGSSFKFYSKGERKTYRGPLNAFVENFFKQPVIQPPTTLNPSSSKIDYFNNFQGRCDVVEVTRNSNNGDSTEDLIEEDVSPNTSNNNDIAFNNSYAADQQIIDETFYINNNRSAADKKVVNGSYCGINNSNDCSKTNDKIVSESFYGINKSNGCSVDNDKNFTESHGINGGFKSYSDANNKDISESHCGINQGSDSCSDANDKIVADPCYEINPNICLDPENKSVTEVDDGINNCLDDEIAAITSNSALDSEVREINEKVTKNSDPETNDINVFKPINESSCNLEETIPIIEALDNNEAPPGQIETTKVDESKPEEFVTLGSIERLENVDGDLDNVSIVQQKIPNSEDYSTSFQEKSDFVKKSVGTEETNFCDLKNDSELTSVQPNGTDVNIKKTVNSIKKLTSQNLRSKYDIKECSVILTRILVNPKNSNIEKSTYRKESLKQKKRGRKSKTTIDNNSSLRENQVQSEERCKDENYNSRYTLPLQNKNQRVLSPNNIECVLEEIKKKLLVSRDKMNPMVILKRIEDSRIKSLLSRVPGISDTKLFLPENTNRIVNVVQIAGGRTTSTVPAPNSQTSTQVSPHIQRIGQPRNEKNEQAAGSEANTSTNSKSANTYTITKPVATQSPTLINILSQQVRPSPSNNVRTRTGPLINILSSQSIKAANVTVPSKTTTTTVTSDSQVNTPRIIATTTEQQQIINQIVNPGRTTGQIKHVVDGKLIPVTSFPSNRLVKVGSTPAVSTTPDSPNLEDNVNKLVPSKKSESNELSETLPKFQQAFGKSVYQNKVESTNITNSTNNANSDNDKNKTQLKNSSVNLQPIQGGVIYTRQMPVGQTINLIPQTRGQVFRIATTNADQISLVKDTVIHSKMSALLAAALQGKPKPVESTTDSENNTENNNVSTTTATRVQIRPTLVQNARIVKPVIQIPSNVIRNTPQANLSSTTLEQLREFDMVYKQVKERSSTSTPSDNNVAAESDSPPQRISVTYLNQGQKLNCAPVVVVSSYSNLQPAASPALSVASHGSSSPCVTPAPASTSALPKVTAKSSKGKSVKNSPLHASKISPIPKPQQKPQEDEHTTQRIFDILAEYAEQLRNSPDLNNKPAPRRRSNPPTNPSQNSKRKKSSSSKKSGQCSLSADIDIDDPRTIGSEDSSCGVVQLSVQDDEQTPTTASTSESNDSTVTTRQQLILTDSTQHQTRNLIIADSSVGEALKMPNTAVLVPGNYIMPVSMVKGGQQIAVVSGGSKILATVPARSGPNMLLFQSFLNQNRKSSVPTVKYSTIQPISGISSQTLTGVSAQPPVILPPPSHSINTVTLGQSIAIKKIEDSDRVNTELLLTISQSRENNCTTSEDTPQPDSSTSIVKIENIEIDESTAMSDNSSEKTFTYQKTLITTPIATPVIAQNVKDEVDQQSECTSQSIMTLNINSLETKGENAAKSEERVQSVLVAAGSSNGPMLSHSPPQYKQSDCNSNTEQSKDDFLRNSGKRSEKVANAVYCMQGKKKVGAGRLDREVQQICLQRRQAAIERELRLQKSLSEECEDLGVDEPSTSDLFPEALLFDSNNSPSFDQSSQDLIKRSVQLHEKEETKLTLFSDDDFMFEPVQYQTGDAQLCYEEVVDSQMITNGQSTRSPCEDNTLLQTCTSMSDVTLSSPISPEAYRTNTPPPLNKYMHKYTNKKKSDRPKQVDTWPAEVSSSEDTTGSNELVKCTGSPDICLNKRSDEELSDGGNFKVVRLSISKSDCAGDLHCSDDLDSLSGRGARKSVKKMCSCCNGADDNAISRKRPSTHQHTTNPHKKAFPNKKR